MFALEPNLPRRQWSLGHIIETYPGRDGHTRVAKVQCEKRTVVRPIHKLGPLQTDYNIDFELFLVILITLVVAWQCGEGNG